MDSKRIKEIQVGTAYPNSQSVTDALFQVWNECKQEAGSVWDAAPLPLVQPGYEPLAKVLQAALDQSALGKGKERHATAGKPFISQPICEIGRMVGIGYNVGQAMKKGQEAMRLPTERAQAELLGAIVYMASAYLLLGEGDGSAER